MTALVDGIVIGIGAGLVIDVKFGPAYGLATGAVIGVTYGLYMLLSRAASYLLVSFQLAKLMHTPVRLMKFLEDARHRNVLRTVGPVYQFRHARLQDRLAEQATASAAAHDPSKATAV